MTNLMLKLHAFAGSDVRDVAADLCAVADRVGLLCEVECNGVKLWARPGDDPARLFEAWDEQLRRPAGQHKIAQVR